MNFVTLVAAACIAASPAISDTTANKEVKTTFQTSKEWTATCDNRADAAMVYGIGGDPSDKTRTGATFEERAVSWREHGYHVDFMTGIAWGEYKDYVTGQWDGHDHLDEVQTEQNGQGIWHGKLIPYHVPVDSYIQYLCSHMKRVIDAGIDDIFLEEPEFWARGGYSKAFKDEWQKYYGFAWRPQDESPESAYLSNKLKYHLYYNAIEKVSAYAKSYGQSIGRHIRIFIPTHSLINYSQWSIVSPEASLASLDGIDGYIAQVWTNTSKEPCYYEGKWRERIFETGFLEYGCMESMTAPTGRKIFFLTDPVEDKVRDWAEYKRNYEATYTAQLMYPHVVNYEVMPWPNRIYERKYKMSADSDQADWIPDFYATQMQIMICALNDMPYSDNEVSGSHGVSMLMSNSLMFQRLPTFDSYDDPQLSNLLGQAIPLMKRGVPVGIVHMENLALENCFDGTDILLMTYSDMKPMEEWMHRSLEKWVKQGGIIIYSGRDNDPYQTVQEWWNTGKNKYKAPSEHLFRLMGMKKDAKAGLYKHGKGYVCVLRNDPKEYVLNEHGYDEFLSKVEELYCKVHGEGLRYKNSFVLHRGIYDIISVVDESVDDEPLHLSGTYIDLFDCDLPVVHEKDILPGQRDVLIDVDRAEGCPAVLATANRVYDEVINEKSISFVAKGPDRLKSVARVKLPAKPCSVIIDGEEALDEGLWDESSHTYLLRHASKHDGTSICIKW